MSSTSGNKVISGRQISKRAEQGVADVNAAKEAALAQIGQMGDQDGALPDALAAIGGARQDAETSLQEKNALGVQLIQGAGPLVVGGVQVEKTAIERVQEAEAIVTAAAQDRLVAEQKAQEAANSADAAASNGNEFDSVAEAEAALGGQVAQHFTVNLGGDGAERWYWNGTPGQSVLKRRLAGANKAIRAATVRSIRPLQAGASTNSGLLFDEALDAIIAVKVYNAEPGATYRMHRLNPGRDIGGVPTHQVGFEKVVDGGPNVEVALFQQGNYATPADGREDQITVPAKAGFDTYFKVRIKWSSLPTGNFGALQNLLVSPECAQPDVPNEITLAELHQTVKNDVALKQHVFARRAIIPQTEAPFTFDPGTGTLAWPEFNVTEDDAISNRFRVAAGSMVVPAAGQQVVFLDLADAFEDPDSDLPNTTVKLGTYAAGTFVGSASQMPLFTRNGRVYDEAYPLALLDLGDDERVLMRTEDVGYTGGAVAVDRLHFYVPLTGSSQYIHLVYAKHVDPAKHADSWTWQGSWLANRTGFRTFDDVEQLQVEWTELDFAIREKDKPDFTGGRAHGWEKLVGSLEVLIDGSATLISASQAWYEAAAIELLVKANHLEHGNSAEVVRAEHRQRIRISAGGVEFRHRLENAATWTINVIYLGLNAMRRRVVSGDTNSAQIVNTLIDDKAFSVTDVSAAGVQFSRDRATELTLISSRLRLAFGLRVWDLRLGDSADAALARNAIVEPVEEHTKVYIGMAGTNTLLYQSQPLTWRSRWTFEKYV